MSDIRIDLLVSNAAKARKVVRKLRNGCWLVGYDAKQKAIYGFAPKGLTDGEFFDRLKKEYLSA